MVNSSFIWPKRGILHSCWIPPQGLLHMPSRTSWFPSLATPLQFPFWFPPISTPTSIGLLSHLSLSLFKLANRYVGSSQILAYSFIHSFELQTQSNRAPPGASSPQLSAAAIWTFHILLHLKVWLFRSKLYRSCWLPPPIPSACPSCHLDSDPGPSSSHLSPRFPVSFVVSSTDKPHKTMVLVRECWT